MSDDNSKPDSEDDAALERQILAGRKFTLEEAVARMAGPGAMKGESPVARLRQAEIEIEMWLGKHVSDPGGALPVVLNRQVKGSEALLNGFEQPLVALASHCQHVLDSQYRLEQLVREADVEWSRVMDERPYFDRPGAPRHPDDPYTVESVRRTLNALLRQLTEGAG